MELDQFLTGSEKRWCILKVKMRPSLSLVLKTHKKNIVFVKDNIFLLIIVSGEFKWIVHKDLHLEQTKKWILKKKK